MKFNKKQIFSVAGIVFLIFAIAIGVYLAQNPQIFRSRAVETTSPTLVKSFDININCASHRAVSEFIWCETDFNDKTLKATEEVILGAKFIPQGTPSCSKMRYVVTFDGGAFSTTFSQGSDKDDTGQLKEIVAISPTRPGNSNPVSGAHLINVKAYAESASCPTGQIGSWSGKLELYTYPTPELKPLTINPVRSVMLYPHYLLSKNYPWFYNKNNSSRSEVWTPDYDYIIRFAKETGFNNLVVSNSSCNPLDGSTSCNEQIYKEFVKGLVAASATNQIDIVPTINNTATTVGTNPSDWLEMKAYIDELTDQSLPGVENIKGFYFPFECPVTPGPFRADLVRARIYLNDKGLYLMQIPYIGSTTYENVLTNPYGYRCASKDGFDLSLMQNGVIADEAFTALNITNFKNWVQPGAEGGTQIEVRQLTGLSNEQNVYRQMVITRHNMPKHIQTYWLEGVKGNTGDRSTDPEVLLTTLFKQFFKGELYDLKTTPVNPVTTEEVIFELVGNPLGRDLDKVEIYVDNVLKHTCNKPITTVNCRYIAKTSTLTSGNTYYAKIYEPGGFINTTTKTVEVNYTPISPTLTPTPTPSPTLTPTPQSKAVTAVSVNNTFLDVRGINFNTINLVELVQPGSETAALVNIQYSDGSSISRTIKFRLSLSTSPTPIGQEPLLVRIKVIDEFFMAAITDSKTKQEAIDIYQGRLPQKVVIGQVVDDRPGKSPYDDQWSWHLAPASVRFNDVAMELCDGKPSYVEANLTDWLEQVGSFCPWNTRIESIVGVNPQPTVTLLPTVSPTLTPTPTTVAKVKGDADGNGCVSIGDFNLWLRVYTQISDTNEDRQKADLYPYPQGDDVVNTADFNLWLQEFSSGSGSCI